MLTLTTFKVISVVTALVILLIATDDQYPL